jgi:hypothetical protein
MGKHMHIACMRELLREQWYAAHQRVQSWVSRSGGPFVGVRGCYIRYRL